MDALGPGDPRQVGPYTLLGRLGEGGMGRVFLATSPSGRQVAVKILHPGHASRPLFRSRFAREARAARRVNARYTAPVVDADPDGDPPWLATAYVPGPSLKAEVAEHGPLEAARALRLGAQLAEGLAAIHAAGLIHRDLKPANIILAADGARIIDFGVARILEASMLTAPGALVGTYAFMSPEQIRAEPAGPESDVFSLGSVLVFATTGHGPFDAPYPAILARLLHDPPRLDGVPDGRLRGIVTACLRKAAADRPSLADLATLLSPPRGRAPAPGRPSPGDRRPAGSGSAADRGLPLDAELPLVLAGTAARLGHASRALDLAARVRDHEQRAWALADVACSLATPLPGAIAPGEAGPAEAGPAEADPAEARAELAAATARAAAAAAVARAGGQRAGGDDDARVTFATRMCFGGHPLARAALALAATGQRGRAVRLATDIADPWIRSTAWSSIVASGRGRPADAAAALAAALDVGAAHEQVLALAELARALRERSPASALDVARHAAGVSARSPGRLLGLSDLMWPRHARYGSLCREQAGRLRRHCQRLPPGPDDEVTDLLARSLAQAGLLADVDLAAYALSRADLREAAIGCFTGLVLAEATAGDPDFRTGVSAVQALLTATAGRVVAGVFLRQGRLAAAREIALARRTRVAAGIGPAGHEPAGQEPPGQGTAGQEAAVDEAGGRRWLELLADFGPAEPARAACASAAEPELPLARLAWRLEAAGAAGAAPPVSR